MQERYEDTYRAVRDGLEGQHPWADSNVDLVVSRLNTINANLAGINLVCLLILVAAVAVAVKVWFF